jgi:hypothetical protein
MSEDNSVLEKTEEDSFQKHATPESISFPRSVIMLSDFIISTVCQEVLFVPNSRLQVVDGFMKCMSFSLVDIPGSVEMITRRSFTEWASLKELRIGADSCLRQIAGFEKYISLCCIAFPARVEMMGPNSFLECTSLNEVLFAADSYLRKIKGLDRCM